MNCADRALTASCISGDARRSTMWCATRQARGFPPNVVPWSPVLMCGATVLEEMMVAPMGMPLPRALAEVRISGCAVGVWEGWA